MGHNEAEFDAREAGEVARALATVAGADGAVVAREEQFLEGFTLPYSLPGGLFIAQPLDIARLAAAVRDPAKRRRVVRLCVEMAHVDRDYAAPEQAVIIKIAAAFDIGDAELASITNEIRAARGLQ